MIYKPNKLFWRHFWVVISAMAEQNTSSSHGTQKWNAKFQNLEHFVSGPIHPFYGPVKCNRQFQIQTCVGTCLMAVWNIIYFRETAKWNAHSKFGILPFRVNFQHFYSQLKPYGIFWRLFLIAKAPWLHRTLHVVVELTHGTRIPNFGTLYFASDSTISEPGET